MDYFVKPVDNLSRLINEKAEKLYLSLKELPLEHLDLSELSKSYFKGCHQQRNFFSVQTAAELLYRSIILKGKPVEETIIMDYGAGVGSLYLLAKMIGCKMVVYNDIMAEMTDAAEKVANYLKITIDLYITADHSGTIEQLNEEGISCDIILSRNVVEHIYDLNDFYKKMSAGQPDALIYFSTTANYQNPAMLLFHKRLHKKHEQVFMPVRKKIISSKLNAISSDELERLAIATRGLAMQDLDNAIEMYRVNGVLPNPDIHYSNTCNPENGVWSEHILPVEDYEKIIATKGYNLTILPAFWDTHYSSALKNIVGKMMNFLTGLFGNKGGLKTTAFIYIIAEKK
jgi:2-polyprenyl-3-methyl-5-hydroxy-6-metoxy-1,4-benzoquinol methylase